jgi:hypothetical protein
MIIKMFSSSPMLFLAIFAAFFLCGVLSRPPMGDERDVPTAMFRGILHVIQQQNDGYKHANKREVAVVDGENNSDEKVTMEKLLGWFGEKHFFINQSLAKN